MSPIISKSLIEETIANDNSSVDGRSPDCSIRSLRHCHHVGRHVRHDGVDSRYGIARDGCPFPLPQYGIHLVQQCSCIVRRRHAQNLVLLEFPCVVIAQALLNFGRESIEILILSDIELRQELHQVVNICDQGTVETRLGLVEPVDQVSDGFLETLPQIGRASAMRLISRGMSAWSGSYADTNSLTDLVLVGRLFLECLLDSV